MAPRFGGLLLIAALALAMACSGASRPPGETPTPTQTAVPPGGTVPASPPAGATPPMLSTRVVVDGLTRPTFVTHAGDGSGRLFVLEKRGTVRVVAGGRLERPAFLDITNLVDSGANERGLLGLAFHPDFTVNGRLFVTYTARDGRVVLAEYRANADGSAADPRSARVLLGIAHPRSNHNGGMIAFGPDGYLYMGTGDGGGSGDPDRAGQDLLTFAGKILRLDVDRESTSGYAIPDGNPFIARSSARGEIWAYGLRNPWRFSFDRETGDLWIGDVGQNAVEEIDFQSASSRGGENYGWSVREGDRCFRPASGCESAGMTEPIYAYPHNGGCSVTGGYVYQGSAVAGLQGFYVFADYCEGEFIALRRTTDGGAVTSVVGRTPRSPTSFGEDERGEVYVLSDDGTLSIIEASR